MKKWTNLLVGAVLVLMLTGCATLTPALRESVGRATADVTITRLIDKDKLTPEQALDVVAKLREALEKADNIPAFEAAIDAALAPYPGAQGLARVLRSVSEGVYKVTTKYRRGLAQALNQAELAASEHPNVGGP